MGGPGSTGSAEDKVNVAINATSPPLRTLPGLTLQPCLPQPSSAPPPNYLGHLSLLTLDNPTTITPSPSPTCDAQARQHSLELKGRHGQGRREGRTGY